MPSRPEIDARRHRVCVPRTRVLCCLAILCLSGCARLGNAELQFTPSVFSECEGPDIVVSVAWDATLQTQGPVFLEVHRLGQRPQLWMETAASGHSDTGDWMSDGTTIELRDDKGRLLAMRTLEMTPCPADASTTGE